MNAVSTETKRAWAAHLGVAYDSIEPTTLREDLSRGSLPLAFAEGAAARPSSTLRVADDCVSLRELQAQAARTATVLRDEGVIPGTRVIICARTSVPFIACYLGALWAGATVVLANPDYTEAELNGLVKQANPKLVVTESRDSNEAGRVSLADITNRSQHATGAPMAAVGSDDIALLAFTSGTTGAPKGVPLTHGNLLSSIRAVMLAWRWTANDTLVHALPLFHQHGLSGVHACLIAGSNITVLDKFDPQALVSTCRQTSATVMFGVPSIHQRLVELQTGDLRTLGDLRIITSGSAPLSPALEGLFAERTANRLLQRYGSTESGLNVSNPYDGERVVGTVGFALPGVEVTLFTPVGTPATDGEGEICFRGPQVFAGYLDDAAATASAFWPDGWFRTGDLGRWEADRLVISGRLKELIITGGMNVTPREVEFVLEQLPGIAQAAVGGLPSERWGEEVAAWIVIDASADVDADTVISHCRSHLTAYKCPKRVFVVDSLPRNAMGKIVRSRLTDESAG